MPIRVRDFTEEEIRRITITYISSDVPVWECALNEGLTESMFRKVISRAIVEHIVTGGEVDAIENKAVNYSYTYGGGAGAARKRYAKLRKERARYILPDKKKAEYALRYATWSKPNLNRFVKAEYIPFNSIIDAIESVIRNRLVDHKNCQMIVEAVMKDDTAKMIQKKLNALLVNRKSEATSGKPVQVEKKLKNGEVRGGEQLSLFADDYSLRLN